MDKKEQRQSKEPQAPPPPREPARAPIIGEPRPHPTLHRHEHAVIHPANSGVSHTDPGGTIHIGR